MKVYSVYSSPCSQLLWLWLNNKMRTMQDAALNFWILPFQSASVFRFTDTQAAKRQVEPLENGQQLPLSGKRLDEAVQSLLFAAASPQKRNLAYAHSSNIKLQNQSTKSLESSRVLGLSTDKCRLLHTLGLQAVEIISAFLELLNHQKQWSTSLTNPLS